MLTATQGKGRPSAYRLNNGKRVPGSTTIAKLIDDPGGLIHWAWQCGADGKDYREERDSAGSAGTLAHDLIEAFVHGQPTEPPDGTDPEMAKLAVQGLESFKSWLDGSRIKIVNTETPLVSETYQFGGTRDAMGERDGTYSILDWKSGGSVYPAAILQVASYALLAEECEGIDPTEAHIIRVGKEHANFVHVGIPASVLELAKASFLRARALYEDRKELKKITR